jgi:hypothetical protein
MTEQEWLDCDISATMVEFVRAKTTTRKLQMFAAACFRRLSGLLPDNRQQHAIELPEAMPEEMEVRRGVVRGVRQALPSSDGSYGAVAIDDPYFVGLMLYRELVSSSTAHHATHAPGGLADGAKEQQEQCRLLRDVIGSPFRSLPAINPDWLIPSVLSLAQAAYEERRFPYRTLDNDRLAVLADALEDAGCDNPDILDHCRQKGDHVRGCWVVDLLLGIK